MRRFWALCHNEVRTLYVSPATYITALLFLILMIIVYGCVLEDCSQSLHTDSPATLFFKTFWLPMLFMVPLLTMRSFAEERRVGTLETLFATPVTPRQVVWSKFLGAYTFYLMLWALTAFFPWIAKWTLPAEALDPKLFDTVAYGGGYGFVFLSGVLFVAVGILASSLTRSQLVAGALCFSGLFIGLLFAYLLLKLPWAEHWMPLFEYIYPFDHLDDMSRGIWDSRVWLLYPTLGVGVLEFTVLIWEGRQ